MSASNFPALTGQQLQIPNLTPVFTHWRQGVNHCYERLKMLVDERLGSLVRDEVVLKKVKAGNMGLFASCLFPDLEYDKLQVAALFTIWLFLWDDVVDGGGGGDDDVFEGKGGEVSEVRKAERYRDRSLQFVRFCLLGGSEEVRPEALSAACGLFAEVARGIHGEDEGRKRQFLQSIEEYMEACVVEARWRVSGRLPRVEEFYGFRLNTAGVEMLLDLSEMLNEVRLPEEFFESGEVRDMKRFANMIGIIINELFSLKKELKDTIAFNLIPIMMQTHDLDLASATSEVLTSLQSHVRDFDRSASALRSGAGRDTAKQVDKLIAAYQALVTCVLTFSVKSPRYGLLKDRRDDGSFLVTL
ncbi:isoprenoid synthase domain-containing protein [Cercophora newfieldiana]|uniref:Terpene synthase n=1 Tax=Cercophora newfieldiana TaxID=92897 RepID=A0AA39XVX3_9PEZI|nr:isoprenoid synthase domain-containing protein [Cercophora newfieldiana]